MDRKKILDRDAENHQRVKMLVTCDDGKIEELMTHNELCDIVEDQQEKEADGELDAFAFREVLKHQGPMGPVQGIEVQCQGDVGRWFCDVGTTHGHDSCGPCDLSSTCEGTRFVERTWLEEAATYRETREGFAADDKQLEACTAL